MKLTFDTLIKKHYGSQDQMDKALGLGNKTVNRWYNHDPKRSYTTLNNWLCKRALTLMTYL